MFVKKSLDDCNYEKKYLAESTFYKHQYRNKTYLSKKIEFSERDFEIDSIKTLHNYHVYNKNLVLKKAEQLEKCDNINLLTFNDREKTVEKERVSIGGDIDKLNEENIKITNRAMSKLYQKEKELNEQLSKDKKLKEEKEKENIFESLGLFKSVVVSEEKGNKKNSEINNKYSQLSNMKHLSELKQSLRETNYPDEYGLSSIKGFRDFKEIKDIKNFNKKGVDSYNFNSSEIKEKENKDNSNSFSGIYGTNYTPLPRHYKSKSKEKPIIDQQKKISENIFTTFEREMVQSKNQINIEKIAMNAKQEFLISRLKFK